MTFGPNDPPARERFPTLIAARLVRGYEGPGTAIYDGISLVNLFRVVLNATFNTALPLLPDQVAIGNGNASTTGPAAGE